MSNLYLPLPLLHSVLQAWNACRDIRPTTAWAQDVCPQLPVEEVTRIPATNQIQG